MLAESKQTTVVTKTVLVVEDSKFTRAVLRDTLEEAGYLVGEASTATEGMKWVEAHRPDLVLLDLRLPDQYGFEMLPSIKEHCPSTPVIILSGNDEVHSKVRGLRLGADDYIIKPVVSEELVARIDVHLRNVHARDGVAAAAPTGDAYGLDEGAARSAPVTALVADIDELSELRRDEGEASTATVVAQVEELIRGLLGKHDFLVRTGEGEFLIGLPGAEAKDAMMVARELLRGCVQETTTTSDGHPFWITVSIGVAGVAEDRVENLDQCLAVARSRAAKARHQGRGCAVGPTPVKPDAMRQAAVQRKPQATPAAAMAN